MQTPLRWRTLKASYIWERNTPKNKTKIKTKGFNSSIEWVNQGMEEGRREGREEWRHLADSVVTGVYMVNPKLGQRTSGAI